VDASLPDGVRVPRPFDLSNQYGKIIVVFKPEVALRTTYSSRDTFTFDPYVGLSELHGNSGALASGTLKVSSSGRTPFIEAQVWGELDLRDVREFLVPKDLPADSLAKLRAFGLPIYSYEPRIEGIVRAKRIEKLFEGDPQKITNYAKSLLQVRQRAGMVAKDCAKKVVETLRLELNASQ
jgi:hypothetical protein